MEARTKKPGSVRLNELQYTEMERLGFTSESAYVKYKLEEGQTKLNTLKTPMHTSDVKMLPAAHQKLSQSTGIEDQLTIQRLSMENRKLQEKLEEVTQNNRETLNGVNHKVHSMLLEELQKRDFEALKKSHSQREHQVQKLEEELKKAQKESESKQEEIESLVKKLSFVELGKALLPGAISGLARQYPNQMKGIAGTLGRLGISDNITGENLNGEEDSEYMLQVLNHLHEVFTEEQFEQVVQLMVQLGDQIKNDQGIIQKINYYLNQLKRKTASKNQIHKEVE